MCARNLLILAPSIVGIVSIKLFNAHCSSSPTQDTILYTIFRPKTAAADGVSDGKDRNRRA